MLMELLLVAYHRRRHLVQVVQVLAQVPCFRRTWRSRMEVVRHCPHLVGEGRAGDEDLVSPVSKRRRASSLHGRHGRARLSSEAAADAASRNSASWKVWRWHRSRWQPARMDTSSSRVLHPARAWRHTPRRVRDVVRCHTSACRKPRILTFRATMLLGHSSKHGTGSVPTGRLRWSPRGRPRLAHTSVNEIRHGAHALARACASGVLMDNTGPATKFAPEFATINDPRKQAHACLRKVCEPSTKQLTKRKAPANEASACKSTRHASHETPLHLSGIQTGIRINQTRDPDRDP